MINFDLISEDIDQSGSAAVRGFRMLREQDFFKEIDNKKSYIVWADCGPHFRCSEFLGYLLLDLANAQIQGNYCYLEQNKKIASFLFLFF